MISMYWYSGTPINIRKMTDNHIKNTISFLKTNSKNTIDGFSASQWIDNFQNELSRRIEMGNVMIRELPELRNQIFKAKSEDNNAKWARRELAGYSKLRARK